MKKNNSLWLLLLALSSVLAACKKDAPQDELSKLPPATQTGANTFGCLVNGKVFIPKGYDGTGRPNPHVQYDYDLNGQPYLTIDVLQYENGSATGNIYIGFGNLTHTGSYLTPVNFTFLVGWNVLGNCNTPPFDSTLYRSGGGVITRLDIPNKIISGTFVFKYKTIQCDTVRITNGRFDIKF